MKVMWPLFWCLEPECQAMLIEFQWGSYGLKLQMPPMPDSKFDTKVESPEEINRLMRQPPKHSKRVV